MMRQAQWPRWVLVGSLVVALAAPLGGDTPDEALARQAQAIDGVGATPPGQERVATRVAVELNAACGCTAYSAASVTAQQAQNGWGWGEVVIANRLAQALVPGILTTNPALTPQQALALATANVTVARQSAGWGAIARANGLRLGDLVSSVGKTASALGAVGKARGVGSDKAGPGHDKADRGSSADKSASADRGSSDRGGGDKGGGGREGGEGHGGGGGGGGGGKK
jgi:hypothetical protein